MAGAGYKVFNTGDVLTASDVNLYLQQQVVMVFASAAARTSALSGVLAEGMVTYLQDTNSVQVYNGTAFVAVGGSSPLTTKGDLYTFSTTDARLPVGTNGQVLTANSATATGLEFATPASGGGMTLLQSLTLTGSSTTSSSLSNSYKNLFIAVQNLYVAADEPNLTIRFNSDTGSNYTYQNIGVIDAVVSGRNDATTNTSIEILNRTPNVSTQIRLGFGEINIRNYTNTSAVGLSYTFTGSNNAGRATALFGTGVYDGTEAISTITFTPASSTFSGGTALIYGVN